MRFMKENEFSSDVRPADEPRVEMGMDAFHRVPVVFEKGWDVVEHIPIRFRGTPRDRLRCTESVPGLRMGERAIQPNSFY